MADRTAALGEAIAIMARLRGPHGCPWDQAQDFQSIRRHTLEETYEVFDAIDRSAWPELKDELGDLLLQVLFYAQMAEEAGYFSIEDVAANLNAKLIRRHPHIFGDAVAHTPEDVKRTWDAVKRQEKAGIATAPARLLDEVKRHQPAMLEAAKLGERAASVGFDWPDVHGLLGKVAEETEEIRAELARTPRNPQAIEDEIGDLFFTAVNLARHLGIEPEFALRGANDKFRGRFHAMEDAAGGANALRAMSLDTLDSHWREAKQGFAERTSKDADRDAD